MRKISIIFFILFFFTSTSYPATKCYSLFKKGYYAFHRLKKDKKRSKYRSNWLRVRTIFLRAYKCNKTGPYAPKSLYYIGRVYQELGKRSYLKKDFLNAIKYFDLLVRKFPKHSWCDDAKLYSAKIKLYYLKNIEDAYIDLLYIVNFYPKGDKFKEAKRLLDKIETKKKYSVKIKKITKKSTIKKRSKVLNIRKWISGDYARVVLDLSNEVKYRKFTLKTRNYYRIVVDIQGAFLSKKLLKKKKIRIKKGILYSIRFSQYKKDVVRVVVNVKGFKDFNVFALRDPFRLVLDVYGKRKKNEDINIVKDTIKSKKVSELLVEQLGLDIRTIMIDPGHGGKDPGAMFGSLKEKDINLRLAKILGRMLKKKGFRVLYTRTKDVFIPLEERTVMANSMGADLFISLHVNAHRNRRVRGIEVYYLNLANSKEAVRVAARENAVSSKSISDLQAILTDLMLNSKIKESSVLASKVLFSVLKDCRKYRPGSNGVRHAPFYVLMGARMPAILIEIGYITNPIDRKRLMSYSYLKRLAKGIVNGILAYRRDIKKFARL